ncbi:MAG: hypothetical protein OEZ30_03750, partial [Candidatus Aminicenantes bacterium]|nr:hypothetical protein [Candidatus Aminicenantes bacterium]
NETTHRVYLLNRLPQYTSVVDARVVVVDGVNKKVLATISTGGEGGRGGVQGCAKLLAVNEATNTIYVTDYLEDRLMVIDGVTHAVSEIPVGPSPVQVAVNEKTNKIFVLDEEEDVLYFIDGTSQTILARLNLPYRGVGYSRMMVNERLNRVYLIQRGNQVLISINALNYSIYRIITLSAGPSGVMAVNETSGKIYLPLGDATIDVVRDRKSEVTNIATSITDSEVIGIAIDEGRNLVYATQYAWPPMQGKVVVIDGETNTELKTIDVGDWPRYIAINEDTNMLFVDNEDDLTISIINRGLGDAVTTSNKLGIVLWDVDINLNPSSPNYRRVYIDAYDTDSILIYNDSTGEVCPSTIPVGYGPWRVKVNDNLDKLYVPCVANTIWVVTDDLTCGSSPVRAKPPEVTVISDPGFIFSPKSPEFKKFVDSLPSSPFKELVSRLRENTLAPPSERGMDSSGAGTIISYPDLWFNGQIEINKTTDKVYVLGTRGVMVIYDDDTYSITDTYPFCPWRLDIDETRDRIYLSGYDAFTGNGLVAVMDGSTDTFITQNIQVPEADEIEVNEVNNMAYECGLNTSPILSIIDGVSFGVEELNLGWDAYCYAFTVNEASNRIYLSNWYRPYPDKIGPKQFIIVDGSSKTIIPNSLQHGARWMKASDSQRLIYGTSCDNRFFIINDAVDESNISLSSVPVGNIPEEFVVNEATNTAFVLNYGSGTMSIVDTLAKGDITVGQGPDSGSWVRNFNSDGTLNGAFKAFGADNVTGELSIARGDVDGDGVSEVVVGQRGSNSWVKVFETDGTPIWSFKAFGATNPSGKVNVGVGDVDQDGVYEIICGHGPGGKSWIKVFEFGDSTGIWSFKSFGASNTNGEVRVDGGQTSISSVGQVIVGTGHGGTSYVKIFDFNSLSLVSGFKAFGPANASGGVDVASCDVDGDLLDEVIVGQGGPGAGELAAQSYFKVFEADGSMLWSCKAFGSENADGHITVSGDYLGYIIVGEGPSSTSESWVKVYRFLESTPVVSFKAFTTGNNQGGVDVAGER